MFSTNPKTISNFSVISILLSAYAFNLDQSKILLFGKELNKVDSSKFGEKHYFLEAPHPWFLRVCSTGLLKTLWEKEKLLVTSNFSLSHSVFYPFGELSAIFIKFKIVLCKLFEFGRV